MRRPGVRNRPLKGLRRFEQDGKRYVYHRATGLRMPDLPENHPDFLKAYLAAEARLPDPRPRGKGKPGTMLAVWHAFCISPAFRALSDSYQRVLQRDGDKLMKTGGAVPIRQVREHHVQANLAELTPHQARQRRKTWRALMVFALDRRLIHKDPTASVVTPKVPKAQQHAPWTATDIAAFRKRWPIGTTQRLAFEILNWFGCRVSDLVRLGPGHVTRDGWVEYVQKKTGGAVAVPFDRALPEFVDPADLAHLHAALDARKDLHMTWLTTEYGHARSEKSASQWFAKAARAAAIKGKSAHGMRVTRAITLAERGATTNQIGAWTGHESLKEIAHYSRQADRKRMLSGPEPEQQIVQKSKS